MRRRVSALIIKDRKLLVVSDNGSWYWTPGGRFEGDENEEQALRRELSEELGVKVAKMKLFYKYKFSEEDTVNFRAPEGEETDFIVEIEGDPVPSAEINVMKWVDKDELLNLPILESFKENIAKRLTTEKFL